MKRTVGITVWLLLLASISARAGAADLPRGHMLYRSLDRGRSWSRSDAGLPGNARVNALAGFAGSLFAGTDAGIFLSTDEARTWHPSRGTHPEMGRIASFTVSGQSVFAGSDRAGVLRLSSGSETSWVASPTFPGGRVRCLFAREGVLYAGTDTTGVLVSRDDGQTWDSLRAGLPDPAQIFALGSVNDRLFAALYSQGLYRWNDREQTWVKTGRVTPLALAAAGDTMIAGHNPGGLFWSDDSGSHWHPATRELADFLLPVEELSKSPNDSPVWALAADREVAFAGAGAGIYYSEDKGRTWTRAQTGLPTSSPGTSFLIRGQLVLASTLAQSANPNR